ncbi:MAG: N-acetylglucosamine-6-phosphate deacetylase [Planctomycetota bacterium]|mgnify:CR=1 FL=1|nr:MAG: N-acetylglucosamine-6-phosphate deacetylase [Planctomycetota bacterium]
MPQHGEILHVTGRHYRTRRPVELSVEDGRIADVRALEKPAESNALPWIAPGFIDIQSNGYGGQEFSSPELTVEKVVEIAAQQAAFGVTQFCPTVTTAGLDTLVHSVRTIAEACQRHPQVARTAPAIHLEGPFIASEDGPRGAHPLEHCRPPDWEEFERIQQAADGRIRILTMSPEFANAPEFIRRAVGSGVVVAIGHTAADSGQIRAAVDAGASLSTHLGNGAHRALRRHPNYLWDQLGDDRLRASLIVDGHHLPPEVVQTMVRAKTPERCILISDLSGLAGLPPGRYDTQLCALEILPDGRLVIAGQDQLLAGASRPIGYGVVGAMRFAGVDLATAVHMASHHPARLLGMPTVDLLPGDAADAVLFDLPLGADGAPTALVVRATLQGGELVKVA